MKHMLLKLDDLLHTRLKSYAETKKTTMKATLFSILDKTLPGQKLAQKTENPVKKSVAKTKDAKVKKTDKKSSKKQDGKSSKKR